MISEYTFQVLRRCQILMSWTFMLPYTWDYKANQGCKRLGLRLLISRIWMCFNLLFSMGVLCLYFWNILCGGLSNSEKLLCCLGAIGLTFLAVICLGILVYEDELLNFVNASVRVNGMFGKFYGVNPKDTDGVETFMNCCIFGGMTITVFIGPGAYLLLRTHPEMLPSLVFANLDLGNFFNALHLWWNTNAVTLAIFSFILTVLVMLKSYIDWFRRMSFNSTMSRKQMLQTRLQYRTLQILHNFLMEAIAGEFLLPFILASLLGMIVIVPFTLVRFHGTLNLSAQITMGVICIFILFLLQFLTKLCADVIEASKRYTASYSEAKMTSRLGLVIPLHYQIDVFFRACPPFKFQVGTWYRIQDNVFLVVLAGIFNSAVNLLLSVD